MQKAKIRLAWLFAAMFLALAVLTFFFSSQPGQESYRLTNDLMDGLEGTGFSTLTPNMGVLGYNAYQSFRKWGHIYLFALLGFSAGMTGGLLRGYKTRRLGSPLWREWLIPLGISTLRAVLDEVHQGFVPGREAKLRDVGFDVLGICAGVLAAALLLAVLRYLFKHRKNKKST